MTDYTFQSRVISISERFKQKWVGGAGKDARFEERSLGWFVGLERSHEVLFIGTEKPDIEVDQTVTVRITIHGRQ